MKTLAASVALLVLAAFPAWADPALVLRAGGNEPGWSLVVDDVGLELTTAYGERRLKAVNYTVESARGRQLYRANADGQALLVMVTEQLCTDTMSGLQRPLKVEVEVGADRLSGCGGEVSTLLVGAEWAVQSIDGQPVSAASAPSITFDVDGNVYGNASCNRYRGSYKLTGEGLSMGLLATTMMACPPPAMEQEQRFLGLLAEVRGFEVLIDGTLSLRTADHRTIRARRG